MGIKERRLEKGWSQEELARHSGLSTRTIQRIERGQNAGLESLKCLAAVFETSITTLMQEHKMNDTQPVIKKPGRLPISKLEREAIAKWKVLLMGPEKGQPDPLNKIERDAIDYYKNLLAKFKN